MCLLVQACCVCPVQGPSVVEGVDALARFDQLPLHRKRILVTGESSLKQGPNK